WQALTSDIIKHLRNRPEPPVFMSWGSKSQAFYDQAVECSGAAALVLRTRHPSNDFHQLFMAEGSHFLATADRIDWWALSEPVSPAGGTSTGS
ncbi:MAG: hypothetical protein ACK58T_21825, partial [Phycisphaerae bacterium]